MAVAEARAAWQRTANRCFVQEDAKRAPKLACCPTASTPSKQVDAGPASAADGQDIPTISFLPHNRNASYANLPPDSRWWLQLQPNYCYQRGLINEQLNTLEAEMETCTAGLVRSTSELSSFQPENEDDVTLVDDSMNNEPSFDTHCRTSATCIKKDPGVRKGELKAVYPKHSQDPLELKDMGESYELMEMDPVCCSVSKQPNDLCFDSESPWIGSEKSEPWWRIADRDELALLVTQRSLEFIENCDLPQPQSTHFRGNPYAHLGCSDRERILTSSMDWNAQTSSHTDPTVPSVDSLTSGSSCGGQWTPIEGNLQSCTEKPIRDNVKCKVMTETQTSESDPSKAQLMEALRHSQTRAREAEKAAKEAYAEKEHIVKLFFRQASHLFAYKQWFQLLQIENLYFQIKNNSNQPISTLFPMTLPWTPHKTKKMRKSWQKAAKGRQPKRSHPTCDISKYAVVFALGLGLVGAGLLLGWTMGWMLPTF